tara:strand:- start:119 stop:637 length:519 start_codon:yes stop_codon:yes gene_type:complete
MVDKTKPVVPKSTLTRIVKGIFSIENLSPNQLSTMKASAAQSSVTNALKKRGLKGFLLASALDIAMGMLPEAKEQGKGADPLNLFGPKKKKSKVDEKAVEAAVKEAMEFDTAPETSVRPKTRPSKSSAPETSVRPKTRPRENMMYGGMAKTKPRTGNTDYRKGGMFMKNGKK